MATRIHDFEVVRTLGTGAFGTVVEATDPNNDDRRVAIKVLHQNLVEDPLVVQRFFQEALILAKFKHEAIPAVQSFGPWEGTYYLVQEFIEGKNMYQALKSGPLSIEIVVSVVGQLLDALAYAHDNDVIHRDLKPDNLVRQEDGKIKILDFGIAKILGGVQLTKPGKINVTLPYAAPEQLVGQSMDQRTDIYAAGIILHELLTGEVPFKSEIKDPFPALQEQVEWARGQRPALTEKLPDCPAWLDEFYQKLTAADPDDRFASAAEARQALEEAASGDKASSGEQRVPSAEKPRVAAVPSIDSPPANVSGERDTPTMALGEAEPTQSVAPEKRGGAMSGGIVIAAIVIFGVILLGIIIAVIAIMMK